MGSALGCTKDNDATPAAGATSPTRRTSRDQQATPPPNVPTLTVRKRKSIFETTDDFKLNENGEKSPVNITVMEDSTKYILEKALAEHFGIEKTSAEYLKLSLFVHKMEREDFGGGTTVLTEGQVASKLYIVELGYVQITVKSQFVKTVGKGAVLGEMTLKDDESTTLKSTAHCITKAVLWSLKKEDMQKIEFTSSSEMLLRGALFEYFGIEKYSHETDKIDLFVKSMIREEISSGTTLIIEGDVGNKLYIIESGYFQISIKGAFIRTIGKGKILGDLALLYDAPRSASAHSITDSVVWSLHRDTFRQINIETTSQLFKKRAKWMIGCPELASLNAVNFTRLINAFQSKEVPAGSMLYLAKTLATDCILIESGSAAVYVPNELSLVGKSPAEVDAFLGITRPYESRRRSLSLTLVDYINGKHVTGVDVSEIDLGISDRDEILPAVDDSVSRLENAIGQRTKNSKVDGFFACEVSVGCILATGALKQSADDDERNAWKSTNRTWKFEDGAWHALKTSYGIASPVTVKALEPMKVCAFSFETYDKLLDSPESVQVDETTGAESEVSMSYTVQSESMLNETFRQDVGYDISMFRAKYVMGKGSFGIVLFAELRSDENREACYALKIYDKRDVASNKQLKNVLKSSQLLRKMNSPFVMKLHGTFQTAHQIYLVLEPLTHGCLWDLMTGPPFGKLGLPGPLVQFYIASIILGLAHVHSMGCGYRELKPENVMFDDRGYIRLIDFGMCKRIPYTKQDSRGTYKLYSKSYTLFGTPEYLSPEQVFNLGHDYAVDIWSLGIVMYEMFLGSTPFAPKKQDNLTELFANIAASKKSGPVLPPALEEKARSKECPSLITQLLTYEASERIGVKDGSTAAILAHPYFDNFDLQALKEQTFIPMFIAPPSIHNDPLFNLPGVKKYNGDQEMFQSF